MDAFLFQLFGSLDTFPGGTELDQHTLLRDAGGFVQFDEFVGLGEGSLDVKRQAGIDFGGYAPFDQLEDFKAEVNELHAYTVDASRTGGQGRAGQRTVRAVALKVRRAYTGGYRGSINAPNPTLHGGVKRKKKKIMKNPVKVLRESPRGGQAPGFNRTAARQQDARAQAGTIARLG